MQVNLKTQLIIAFMVVGLIPVIIIGFLCIQTSEKLIQTRILEDIAYEAESIAWEINTEINNRVEDLDVFIHTGQLTESLEQSNKEYAEIGDEKAIYDHIFAKNQELVSAGGENFMQSVLDSEGSVKLKKKMDYWQRIHGHEVIGEIIVTNKYGANVFQTRKTNDFFQGDKEWWRQNNRYFLGKPEYDEGLDMLALPIIIRIHDVSGNFMGVMRALMNFEHVSEIMKKRLHEDQEIALVEPELGNVYASSSSYNFGERLDLKETEEILKNRNGHIVSKHDDVKKLIGYGIPGEDGRFVSFKSIVLIEEDKNKALSEIDRKKLNIVIVIIVFIAAILAVAILQSHMIAEKLNELTKKIDQITKGDFSVKLEKSNIAEFQSLNESLDRILASMKLAVLRTKLPKEDIGTPIYVAKNLLEPPDEVAAGKKKTRKKSSNGRRIKTNKK